MERGKGRDKNRFDDWCIFGGCYLLYLSDDVCMGMCVSRSHVSDLR